MSTLVGTNSVEMQSGDKEALDITPFIQRFVWRDSMILGGWSWQMRFKAEQWDEWTDLLIGKSSTEVQFRMRSQENGSENATAWRRAYVDGSRSIFRGESMLSRVAGGDVRLEMMEKAHTRAFADATASQVFEKIAGEYDLGTAVEATTPRRTRYQLREDDWSFMQRLARDSGGAFGRGDTFLWLDGDTLRFGSPDTQGLSERRHNLSDVENRVGRVIVNFSGREADRNGAATLRRVGYDLDNGQAVLFTFDAAAAQSQPALARRIPREMDAGLRVYPVMEEGQEFAEDAARAQWGDVGPRYYAMRLDTRADLALRPGVVVEVLNTPGPRQLSPVFGRYVVLEVIHTLARGMIVTTAACFRREADEGDADPTGATVGVVGTDDGYAFGRAQSRRRTVRAEAIDA